MEEQPQAFKLLKEGTSLSGSLPFVWTRTNTALVDMHECCFCAAFVSGSQPHPDTINTRPTYFCPFRKKNRLEKEAVYTIELECGTVNSVVCKRTFALCLLIADLYFMHAQFPVDAGNSSAGIRIVYGKGGELNRHVYSNKVSGEFLMVEEYNYNYEGTQMFNCILICRCKYQQK